MKCCGYGQLRARVYYKFNVMFAGAMCSLHFPASVNTTYVQVFQKTAIKFKKLQQVFVHKDYLYISSMVHHKHNFNQNANKIWTGELSDNLYIMLWPLADVMLLSNTSDEIRWLSQCSHKQRSYGVFLLLFFTG